MVERWDEFPEGVQRLEVGRGGQGFEVRCHEGQATADAPPWLGLLGCRGSSGGLAAPVWGGHGVIGCPTSHALQCLL